LKEKKGKGKQRKQFEIDTRVVITSDDVVNDSEEKLVEDEIEIKKEKTEDNLKAPKLLSSTKQESGSEDETDKDAKSKKSLKRAQKKSVTKQNVTTPDSIHSTHSTQPTQTTAPQGISIQVYAVSAVVIMVGLWIMLKT